MSGTFQAELVIAVIIKTIIFSPFNEKKKHLNYDAKKLFLKNLRQFSTKMRQFFVVSFFVSLDFCFVCSRIVKKN